MSDPLIVVPARDLAATYGLSLDEVDHVIREQLRARRAALHDDRRHLLEPLEIVDMARKVAGLSSLGTRAFIVVLQGRDARDPLFLQIQEATAAVLEKHLGKGKYKQHGERAVQIRQMMQAAGEIYLGGTKGLDVNRHFYWRQLGDMKAPGACRVDDTAGVHLRGAAPGQRHTGEGGLVSATPGASRAGCPARGSGGPW